MDEYDEKEENSARRSRDGEGVPYIARQIIAKAKYGELQDHLFEVIRELDQQQGSWYFTQRMRDFFRDEMKKAPKDKDLW